jgi:hypothetical protein
MFLESGARPGRVTGNLTAICVRLFKYVGSSASRNSYWSPRAIYLKSFTLLISELVIKGYTGRLAVV